MGTPLAIPDVVRPLHRLFQASCLGLTGKEGLNAVSKGMRDGGVSQWQACAAVRLRFWPCLQS